MAEILAKISEALQEGESDDVVELVKEALEAGVSSGDILQKGLMAGMDIIAALFKEEEIYVPEVLASANAMKAGALVLKPYLAESGAKSSGKVIIGTVEGDLHDIGKNLVRMMLEGKGMDVKDLGTDVTPAMFLEAYKTEKPDIVALSALLTTTMPKMKTTIDAFKEAGVRDNVVFMIGGAPISETYRSSVGADIYAPDAASAAESAIAVIERKKA
ncbi:MAG: cobalamin-dependent protein [Gracilibacteraceae bacterium]|jgi:5-methyltetrahydrofolate--homocysteine methyltransferase|nr:cobalamin-dependent protein [Gracilibacteraceae bacterium]